MVKKAADAAEEIAEHGPHHRVDRPAIAEFNPQDLAAEASVEVNCGSDIRGSSGTQGHMDR